MRYYTTPLVWRGLGSGAVSWIDERSIELGHHWFDVAHGHYADTEPCTLRSPPTLINWYSSWLITLKFFWTDDTHVPLVPVRDIFLNEYKVLKNPVWCGFYIMAVVIFMTHAAEFDMIHPTDVVEKYAPDAVIGALGDGGEEDDEEDDSSEGGSTMEEVAKYNKKDDVGVVLNGRLLNVSTFLSQHLVVELAIPTSAGKQATAKSDMIHPLAVVEKYAPDVFIGVTGSGKAKKWNGVVR